MSSRGRFCYWCGLPFAVSGAYARSREHLNPRSNGGTNDPSNIAYSHRRCNQRRSSNLDWIPFSIHGQRGMCAQLRNGKAVFFPALWRAA